VNFTYEVDGNVKWGSICYLY